MPRIFCSEERDFLRVEYCPEYSLYSNFIVNETAAEINFESLGLPLKVAADGVNLTPVFAGDEASATAFGVEFDRWTVDAGGRTQRQVTNIQHGPIVVSREGLPDEDPNGDAYDIPALIAVLEAATPRIRIADNSANRFASTIE